MATYSGSDKRIKYLFESGGGGGSSSLAGLSDVELTSPTDGQVLTYNNGEWVNAAGGSGGTSLGTGWILYKTQTGSVAVDITEIYDKATEFYVVAKASGSNSDTLNSLITRNAIENGLDRFGLGGDPNIALIEVSNTAFQLTYMKWGSVVTDNSVLEIYYKTAEAVVAPIIYSQEEREVGVWTNGKPLYQKTSLVSISTGTNTLDTITNGENIRIVEAFAIYNDIQLLNLNYFNSSNDSCVIYTNQNTVYCVAGSSFAYSYTKVLFTIQYTKTTDTAGSGTWTPSGANTVHYSTNEQIIGIWIDGKTLYEATIEVNNPTKQTAGNCYYYEANYSGHNIDYVQCIAKQCHDSHEQRWYDLPYHRIIDTESILCQGMKLDSTGQYSFSIFFRTSEQYSIDKIRYTIQYTKTSS